MILYRSERWTILSEMETVFEATETAFYRRRFLIQLECIYRFACLYEYVNAVKDRKYISTKFKTKNISEYYNVNVYLLSFKKVTLVLLSIDILLYSPGCPTRLEGYIY